MRISDWSSDVCSSDLGRKAAFGSRDLRPPFPYPAAAHEGACLGRSAAVRHTDRLMMKKLAIVAACIAAFPSPASADRVQPPAATPGPITVDGRARVDSRMPDQMTPAPRAAYRRLFTPIRGNQFAAAAPAPNTTQSKRP